MTLDPNARRRSSSSGRRPLDDLCLSVEEMEDAYDELSGQVDEIDEDLGELEEAYYELDDEDFEDEDWDDEDDDECYFEVTCPSCGDTIQPQRRDARGGLDGVPGTAAKNLSSTSTTRKKRATAAAARTAAATRNKRK